jgi:protein gp37
MAAAHHRRYIVLTKRPGKWLRALPASCWVGVTIESQAQMWRWRWLQAHAWLRALKFVSVEPMLGPVSFEGVRPLPGWVIAGPETGPKARQCEAAWIEGLSAESPCFYDKRRGGPDLRKEFPW